MIVPLGNSSVKWPVGIALAIFIVVALLLALVLTGNFGCDTLTAYIPANVTSVPVDTHVDLTGSSIYFADEEPDPSVVLFNLYKSANKTIDVAIYSLTHPLVVAGLRDAKIRGVTVRIITDKQQAGGKSQIAALDILSNAGVPIKIDNHAGLMHLKMSIVDGSKTTLGSYNYSEGASNENDEVMILSSDQALATRCQVYFNKMWADPKRFVNR